MSDPINTPMLRSLVDSVANARRALLADLSLSPEELQRRLAALGDRYFREAPRAAISPLTPTQATLAAPLLGASPGVVAPPQPAPAPIPPQPAPVLAPTAAPAPPAAPVYGSDLGTTLRRAGNFFAPSLVDPATPLTPEEAQAQRSRDAERAAFDRNQQGAQRSFASLAQMGVQQQPQQMDLRSQVVAPRRFAPLQPFAPMQIRRRGLLD